MSDIIGEGGGTSHNWKYKHKDSTVDAPMYKCRTCGDEFVHNTERTPDPREWLQVLVSFGLVSDICPATQQVST